MHKYSPIYVHHQGTQINRPLGKGSMGGRRSIQSIKQMVERVTGVVSEEEEQDDKCQNTRREPLRRPSSDGSGLPFSTTIDSLVIVISVVESVYSEVYT
jgi:hypothetical protein